MFRTTLEVSHEDGNRWLLLAPLVYEGTSQYFIIKSGFETDFASIPKPVRWLLDSAGGNSEAAVLHDAVWRESHRADSRVDPWHADGLFRRALRETGSPALTRGLMWFAVRAAATVAGRFGHLGPPFVIKVLQLLGIFVLGALTALVPTLVAVIGLVVYWVANWMIAAIWQIFERVRLGERPNWPWPFDKKPKLLKAPMQQELLVILDKPRGSSGKSEPLAPLDALLRAHPEPTDAEIDAFVEALAH
jgi:Protein of unknown function (DUF1353).